ncbi:MAG TPA: Crp/Fnr family transcriptional regulator [Candidatus Limnocylindrales bacterium]|nr:Crp/Fnr family transcriptional regulator [Candidatus Limnocylindrales bacterium]
MDARLPTARGPGDAIAAAFAASNFRDVSGTVRSRILKRSRVASLGAGSTLHAEGETRPHFELVLSGLIRVFVGAPDGRTLTVRYCRTGAIIGAASVFGRGFMLPATIQALVDSEVLVLSPDVVQAVVRADAVAADAVLAELSERIQAFLIETREGAFSPLRRRVARHLLDLASASQRSSALVAEVNQRELADACGTVREVVARTLGELRDRGLIETHRAGVTITEPAGLLSVALGEV